MIKIVIRKVEGSSMKPSIKHGSLVIAVKRKQYRPGLIVIADTGEREVVKRIGYISNGHYCLEGDNHDASTSYRVSSERIIGQVVWSI